MVWINRCALKFIQMEVRVGLLSWCRTMGSWCWIMTSSSITACPMRLVGRFSTRILCLESTLVNCYNVV